MSDGRLGPNLRSLQEKGKGDPVEMLPMYHKEKLLVVPSSAESLITGPVRFLALPLRMDKVS